MVENDINAFIQSTNDGVQFEENLIHCKYVFSKVDNISFKSMSYAECK